MDTAQKRQARKEAKYIRLNAVVDDIVFDTAIYNANVHGFNILSKRKTSSGRYYNSYREAIKKAILFEIDNSKVVKSVITQKQWMRYASAYPQEFPKYTIRFGRQNKSTYNANVFAVTYSMKDNYITVVDFGKDENENKILQQHLSRPIKLTYLENDRNTFNDLYLFEKIFLFYLKENKLKHTYYTADEIQHYFKVIYEYTFDVAIIKKVLRRYAIQKRKYMRNYIRYVAYSFHKDAKNVKDEVIDTKQLQQVKKQKEKEIIKEKKKKSISIWIDGTCVPNPGDGAWGFYAPSTNTVIGDKVASQTTNNRMELTAATNAIIWAKKHNYGEVCIYTDSTYVIGCLKKGGGQMNMDLRDALNAAMADIEIRYKWIRGHSGDINNGYIDDFVRRTLYTKKIREKKI